MSVSIGFRAGEYESHQDSPNQCLPNHYKPPLAVEATARSNQIASSFVLRRHRRSPVNWRSASNCIIMRKEISSTILDLGAIRLCLGIGAAPSQVGKPIRSSTVGHSRRSDVRLCPLFPESVFAAASTVRGLHHRNLGSFGQRVRGALWRRPNRKVAITATDTAKQIFGT